MPEICRVFGMSERVGARLFTSSHTVQYHLSKVGITSRGQLHTVLHS